MRASRRPASCASTTTATRVAARAAGRRVQLRAYADRIVVCLNGETVGAHARCFGRDQTVYDPWHYLPVLAAQARRAAQRRAVPRLGSAATPSARSAAPGRARRRRPAVRRRSSRPCPRPGSTPSRRPAPRPSPRACAAPTPCSTCWRAAARAGPARSGPDARLPDARPRAGRPIAPATTGCVRRGCRDGTACHPRPDGQAQAARHARGLRRGHRRGRPSASTRAEQVVGELLAAQLADVQAGPRPTAWATPSSR